MLGAEQIRALNTFEHMFTADPGRTAYGLDAVSAAASQLAIAELLITDKVYRTEDFTARNRLVELMEGVKSAGGAVYKFSSLHVSGEKLDQYTGIAATLRFPVDVAEIVAEEAETSRKSTGGERKTRAQSSVEEDFADLTA